MRIFRIIGGIVSLVVGGLLCFPAGVLGWTLFSHHTDTILSIGTVSFSGWQMWGVVAGLACIGLFCVVFGFYLISTKESS